MIPRAGLATQRSHLQQHMARLQRVVLHWDDRWVLCRKSPCDRRGDGPQQPCTRRVPLVPFGLSGGSHCHRGDDSHLHHEHCPMECRGGRTSACSAIRRAALRPVRLLSPRPHARHLSGMRHAAAVAPAGGANAAARVRPRLPKPARSDLDPWGHCLHRCRTRFAYNSTTLLADWSPVSADRASVIVAVGLVVTGCVLIVFGVLSFRR